MVCSLLTGERPPQCWQPVGTWPHHALNRTSSKQLHGWLACQRLFWCREAYSKCPSSDSLMGFLVYPMSLPISFSKTCQVTGFLQSLIRAFTLTMTVVGKRALRDVMSQRIWHLLLPPGTVLFLTQRGVCWQFPTHRRMASKGPLVQIILTDFFLKWEEKPWQHGLKCSRGVTTTFWVTPSVGRL